jgi:hypothetical protein
MQIISLANEEFMFGNNYFNVEISGRSPTRTYFALPRELNSVACFHTSRNLYFDSSTRANAAVSGTLTAD